MLFDILGNYFILISAIAQVRDTLLCCPNLLDDSNLTLPVVRLGGGRHKHYYLPLDVAIV